MPDPAHRLAALLFRDAIQRQVVAAVLREMLRAVETASKPVNAGGSAHGDLTQIDRGRRPNIVPATFAKYWGRLRTMYGRMKDVGALGNTSEPVQSTRQATESDASARNLEFLELVERIDRILSTYNARIQASLVSTRAIEDEMRRVATALEQLRAEIVGPALHNTLETAHEHLVVRLEQMFAPSADRTHVQSHPGKTRTPSDEIQSSITRVTIDQAADKLPDIITELGESVSALRRDLESRATSEQVVLGALVNRLSSVGPQE